MIASWFIELEIDLQKYLDNNREMEEMHILVGLKARISCQGFPIQTFHEFHLEKRPGKDILIRVEKRGFVIDLKL